MARQGLLILDNSAYARITRRENMDRLRANMRAAWLEPAASEVNLLEAAATRPPSVEAQLIATIREFAGGRPLLEWPFALLRRLGQAMLDGEPDLLTGESGKEWYLEDPEARDALRDEVQAFNANLETAFSQLHMKVRPPSQRWLKERGVRRDISELAVFLDEEWPSLDLRSHIASLTWSTLGLPGDPPLDRLMTIPAWQLLLDAEGAALYARAIVHQQPRVVQRSDLIQLVYLGARRTRILATADCPFLDLATQIVNGRYGGARVVYINEMLI